MNLVFNVLYSVSAWHIRTLDCNKLQFVDLPTSFLNHVDSPPGNTFRILIARDPSSG